MACEVFVQANGDIVSAWDIVFTEVEQRRESRPCTYRERDGTIRKGQVFVNVETARVNFCAGLETVRVGMRGQLSRPDDKFYELAIAAVHIESDHVCVIADAVRRVYERDC